MRAFTPCSLVATSLLTTNWTHMADIHNFPCSANEPAQALTHYSLPAELPSVVEHHLENFDHSGSGSPAPIGKIIHPAEIERYCRLSLRLHPRKNCSEIRLAIEASILYGNEWFTGLPIFRLVSGQADPCISSSSRKVLVDLGIAECKLEKGQFKFRLLGQMVDINHHHGKRAAVLRRDIDTHYKTRTRATPLAVLLLLAIHVQQIHFSQDLHEFLGPEAWITNTLRLPTSTSRILQHLRQDGILYCVRHGNSANQPFTVVPVQG